jgi:TIR domain/WD domain, G-beta repeat
MADETRKLNVFISYSRDDLAFADQLDASLKLTGFGVTIDRLDISGGEEWRNRLGALIRDADTVVFVLSPSSARSEMCAWEVAEAVQLGKRIIPVLCRPLEGASPPSPLAARNYIFYEEPKFPGSGFGTGLVELVSALNTNLDWLSEHTRYLQRATFWDEGGRPANRLLSGPDVATAKDWAARRPKDAPEPTELELDFIKASESENIHQQRAEAQRLQQMAQALAEREAAFAEEKEAQERAAEARKGEAEEARRVVWRTRAGLAVAVALALVAVGFAVFATKERDRTQVQELRANEQRDLAEKATKAANKQRDRALLQESRALAILAQQRSEEGDQPTAMLLALEALPDPGFGGARPWSSGAAAGLHQAWLRNRETALAGHRGAVRSASFSADGTHVITASDDGTARVWDLRREHPSFVALEGHQGGVVSASFSADAREPSQRPMTGRHVFGICAKSTRATSPSRGMMFQSSPLHSAPTADKW